jgi:glycosyltransferase involved in cell wall biosynthesis
LVLSEIPVFVELTERKGSYFPPHDAAAMADAITNVLNGRERQRQLINYGDIRVGAFDFASLAAQVQRIYHEVLDTKNSDSMI